MEWSGRLLGWAAAAVMGGAIVSRWLGPDSRLIPLVHAVMAVGMLGLVAIPIWWLGRALLRPGGLSPRELAKVRQEVERHEESTWLVTDITERDGTTTALTEELDGPRVRLLEVETWEGRDVEDYFPQEGETVVAYGPDEDDYVVLYLPGTPGDHRTCLLLEERDHGSTAAGPAWPTGDEATGV